MNYKIRKKHFNAIYWLDTKEKQFFYTKIIFKLDSNSLS